MRLFKNNNLDETTNSLAAFMPGGRVFAGKNRDGATLRKYLTGLAIELKRVEEMMNLISHEYDITVTTEFINEWESAVGIPDDCFDGTGTLEDRRKAVLAKFALMNLTTEQDFIDLAALFGVNITITTGIDEIRFPFTFPVLMFSTEKAARFTMLIEFDTVLETFPFTFPIPFGEGIIGLIRCLFDKLKPANVRIIYI